MQYLRRAGLAALLAFNNCHAADSIPVNNTTLNVKFDKRNVPSSLDIWNGLSGGSSPDNPQMWGRNTLVCLSTTDTMNGACPDTPTWYTTQTMDKSTKISLRFCNENDTCHDIQIEGYHLFSGYQRSTFVASYGADNFKTGNPFFYYIPQTSLSALPAGTWKATLKQNLMQWDPRAFLSTWTADITLTVTDIAAQTIYFPAFPGGKPLVDLSLRSNASGMVSGSKNLDMCLYDGGISANNIAITFRDEGKTAPGRSGGAFSVYRDGGDPAKAQDRIDYNLQVQNPLSLYTEKVSNGTQINWVGAAASSFNRRQVMLPGAKDMVWCVPAPITLVTPSFPNSVKSGGQYTGTLTVTYAPTTSG